MVRMILWAWLPFVLALFFYLPKRRAVIVAFLFAWMFLPVYGIPLNGLPDYTKMSATCFGAVLGMLAVDRSGALYKLRLHWVDLPVIFWCLSPLVSSITNSLGLYDGLSSSLNQTITWGLPYLVGRVYFTDAQAIRELAVGVFIGGLVYVPFCLWEIRMSPHLHQMVYGFSTEPFHMAIRLGGYRPSVFMSHGLMVASFMTTASLIGVWLWHSGTLRKVLGLPMALLVPLLLITTVLGRSTAALGLLMMGLLALFTSRLLRINLPLLLLIAMPPIYLATRITESWQGEGVIQVIENFLGEDRAGSLQYRIDMEVLLVDKAIEQPLFGWGGWNRSRVLDEHGNNITTPDSLWIIALGQFGLLGLVSLVTMLLLAPLLIYRRLGPYRIDHHLWAPATVLALVCVLYMVDNLLNAMINPIFMLILGACGGLLAGSNQHETAPQTQTVPVHQNQRIAQPQARSNP
jgi:O-antigen ligase